MKRPPTSRLTRAKVLIASLCALLALSAAIAAGTWAFTYQELRHSDHTVRYLIGVVNSDRLIMSGLESDLAHYQEIYGDLPAR